MFGTKPALAPSSFTHCLTNINFTRRTLTQIDNTSINTLKRNRSNQSTRPRLSYYGNSLRMLEAIHYTYYTMGEIMYYLPGYIIASAYTKKKQAPGKPPPETCTCVLLHKLSLNGNLQGIYRRLHTSDRQITLRY